MHLDDPAFWRAGAISIVAVMSAAASQAALHRSRQLLVRQRTMLSNAIRGHMAELGIISAKGRNGAADWLFAKVFDQAQSVGEVIRLSLLP
jgi:transposase